MVEVKKKKIGKLKSQKQFTSKSGLSTYKGKKAENNDKNTAPSKVFLCTKAKKLSLDFYWSSIWPPSGDFFQILISAIDSSDKITLDQYIKGNFPMRNQDLRFFRKMLR